MTTKICCKCNQTKEIEQFTKDKNNKDGRTYDCKMCRSAKQRQWAKDNQEKVLEYRESTKDYRKEYYQRPENKLKFRKKYIKKQHGIDYELYEKLFKQQKNRCAICGGKEPQSRNEHLAIDHCHKTGKVRGLLCSNCNRAIGLLQDDIDILTAAIEYLKVHSQRNKDKVENENTK